MKTLIAVSDTHSYGEALFELLPKIEENDFTVHLGDGFTDFKNVYCQFPKKTVAVRGNCDFFQGLPEQEVLEIEQSRVLCCHGHLCGAKSGLDGLIARAKLLHCNVVLYGHTHRAQIDEIEGILLVNPGTLRLPLKGGGSYAYLVFNGKRTTAVIVGHPMY